MSQDDARRLTRGAIDLGVLAQALRRLLADGSECAITSFSGHGVLWADGSEIEIEPIGGEDVDEALAAEVFCTAWVAARRFQQASAAKALTAARNAAAKAIKSGKSPRTDLV